MALIQTKRITLSVYQGQGTGQISAFRHLRDEWMISRERVSEQH